MHYLSHLKLLKKNLLPFPVFSLGNEETKVDSHPSEEIFGKRSGVGL